ncbi:MAG TPA: hypothetical protein VD973_22665 [Symbiobacteriaceae bacterium]|jgi:hypothetical protein|nr:hypothetical protein [Symbiobacteriaceae bacterium]
MPQPRQEKHPEPKTPREQFMEILDDLCQTIPGVAKRREMLLLIPGLMDKVEEGLIMDAVISGKGILNTITDVGSDSIALVYNNGWALGFEGDGGELVILIDYIDKIQPRKTGLEVDLETGETVYLRFHGRTVE